MTTYKNHIKKTSLDNEGSLELAYKLCEEHNIKVNGHKHVTYGESFLIVGLTGKEQVRYTLYRFTENKEKRSFGGVRFQTLLCDSLLDSIKKVCTGTGLPVLIDNEFSTGRKVVPPSVFGSGKYVGVNINDVFKNDSNYVIWYANNMDIYRAKTKQKKNLITEARMLRDTYFQLLTTKNLENSTSEYVGKLKVRQEWEFTIKYIKTYRNEFGESFKITCEDKYGNRIMFYWNKPPFDGMEVDNGVIVVGTPVDHKEILGIKTTRINRVKLK